MPSLPTARPLRFRLALIAAGALILVSGLQAIAYAADPKPKLKDSRAESRPTQVEVTTKIEPKQAKPGQTVTLSVTAKVDFGWHIYAYNEKQPDDGPKVTQFDLFDTDGLTAQGNWTADQPATKKKEPAFPELPFVEYHEGEVTWTRKLQIPADAAPGKKSIKVQASYQICSDQNCSFPGRWTLAAAEFEVIGGGEAKPKTDLNVSQTAAEVKQPARKDTRAAAKPPAVTLTARVVPAEAHVGETVLYEVTAKLTDGYHIYKYSKKPADDGPKLTEFDFFETSNLQPQGDWYPLKAPVKKHEDVFPNIPFLEFHEDEVTWRLPLTVPEGAELGKKTLRAQIGFQICNDKSCSIPGQWTLPDVELAVAAGPVRPEFAKAPPMPTEPGAAATATPEKSAPAPKEVVAATPPSTPEKTQSEVEKEAAKGLIPFLLACMAGGVGALVMPCVWPMVPITVNFFVKQGQSGKSTTGLAVVYCLSIIGIFTAVGVIFSVFFGAASLSKLANNFWVNAFVATLFLAFGLSLLGLFEIRLPNFLLNVSAQGEGKGGLVGVMFMALTLTITSFTCTFPVVGGLLVIAASGNYFYPIIGLATFAAVVALPFFVLALSPGLLAKMPKSGDWMNCVKVVGGLVEIGAAFKFINTAETAFVVPADAWMNAQAVLTIWIVLAAVCGVYLLGLFRTDHDHEAVKVGPGRIVLGSVFLFLALFLSPALFGRPPQSKLWYMVVGLLPADAGSLTANVASGGGGGGESHETAATSTDPQLAQREQKSFHGVSWGMSYEAAVEEAKSKNIPILIDFTGVNCANCRLMEQEVLPKPEVVDVLNKFVRVQLYTDTVPIKSLTAEQRLELAEANLDRELKLAKSAANPFYVMLSPNEEVLGAKGDRMSPTEFISHLNSGLDKFKATADKDAKAASKDPQKAEREQTVFHGMTWGMSYQAAIEEARIKKIPILISFAGINDANGAEMEQTVLSKPRLIPMLNQFVRVQLYTDLVPIRSIANDEREKLAEANLERELKLIKSATVPYFVVLSPDEEVLVAKGERMSSAEFTAQLESGLEKFKLSTSKRMKVAAAKAVESTKEYQPLLRAQKSFHGVSWGLSYEAGVEEARAKNLPLLVAFVGTNCTSCRQMEAEVFPRPEVVQALGPFVRVQLHTDSVPIDSLSVDQRIALGRANSAREMGLTETAATPHFVILSPDGRLLGSKEGRMSAEEVVSYLKSGLEKLKASGGVASKVSQL